MEILCLEIDSHIKNDLQRSFLATAALGMVFRAKSKTADACPEEVSAEKMDVEIFAEAEDVGRIIKNLIRWARNELCRTSTIVLKSVKPFIP